jgi:hypothetical protein
VPSLITKQLEKGGGIVVAVFPAKDVAVNDPFIQAARTAFSIVKS